MLAMKRPSSRNWKRAASGPLQAVTGGMPSKSQDCWPPDTANPATLTTVATRGRQCALPSRARIGRKMAPKSEQAGKPRQGKKTILDRLGLLALLLFTLVVLAGFGWIV